MPHPDFINIVEQAWLSYDRSRTIKTIRDISANVSTNHVYRIDFEGHQPVIAKLSYFGYYEHFVEDHTIINSLANNLPAPYENLLSRSLMKGNSLFIYRHQDSVLDAWVVFYRPIEIRKKLPRRLDQHHIVELGGQFAHFHQACASIRNTLPSSSKTLRIDINHLLEIIETEVGKFEHRGHLDTIKQHCQEFLTNCDKLGVDALPGLPVFLDWNIGNFSVTEDLKLFSRWDYDWFRLGSRMLDFYFFSRVVSNAGDRTIFSYNISTLCEERFIHFLKSYHQVYPLTEVEIRFLPEAYRFFILNYVIKDGRYFFHEIFATKLQMEAYDSYLPSVASFSVELLLKELNI
jgi:Ser/Thr protein kinase RdoA (MazF antagonist)